MATLDFEREKNAFREFYGSNFQLLKAAEDSFRTLIASLLSGNATFPTPVVTSRLKDREECIGKFVRKYQTDLEEQQQAYEIRDYITDLLGVRVTCYYETDVPHINRILADNFQIMEVTDKTSTLEIRDDTFGYKGLHLDLKLNEQRRTLAEYLPFASLRFEVQIRTIIQHAWSELDHKIKYKKSPPAALKRKINRLAALFELADQEFVNIRIDTEEREKQLQLREERPFPITLDISDSFSSHNVDRVLLNRFLEELSIGEDKYLDAFQFLSVASKEFPSYHFLPYKVDGFVQSILKRGPGFTQAQLSEAVERHMPRVRAYADFRSNTDAPINPYTMFRHVLYLYDKERFSSLLFDRQRANFENWLSELVSK